MHRSQPLQVKRAPAQGRFTALASTFDVDRQGDRIVRGAYARTLAALKARGGRLPLLWQHDQSEPIGSIETIRETADGLEVEAVVALDTESGREAYELLKAGALSLSVGFLIPDGAAVMRDGVREIREVDLIEISVVGVPANPGAVVRDVKHLYPTARDFERRARDALGLSARQAKRLAAGGYAALVATDAFDPAERTAVAAELDSLSNLFRS